MKSFLLDGLSLGLFGLGLLGLSDLGLHHCHGTVERLLAVALGRSQRPVLDAALDELSGDGADDFEFFDDCGDGDVLAEFGDAGNESIVGGPVEKYCVIGLFLDFPLVPFLREITITLAGPLL